MNSVAGNYNEKRIKNIMPIVKQINDLSDEMDVLTDDEIKARS